MEQIILDMSVRLNAMFWGQSILFAVVTGLLIVIMYKVRNL